MKQTFSERNGILPLRAVLACVILFLTTLSTDVFGQARVELITPDSPIPKDSYKSWSLFLVSNPEWVLPESNDKLRNLFEKFTAFGDAIGPEHLAVWFWSRDPRNDKLYKSIDVVRSAAFSTKLKLPLSKGPYVLVTTEYPGSGKLGSYPQSFPDSLDNFQIIEFGGAEASEIMQILTKLGDRLVANGLPKLDPQSEEFWKTWKKSFEDLRNILVGFSKKVKLTIKTGVFEAEIKL